MKTSVRNVSFLVLDDLCASYLDPMIRKNALLLISQLLMYALCQDERLFALPLLDDDR